MGCDTKIVHCPDKRRGRELRYETCRNPVVGVSECPAQIDHLAYPCTAGIAWCPHSAGLVGKHRLSVGKLVTGGEAFLHRVSVEKRLACRTDLTPSGRHHVILEVAEVGTANIGLDMTVKRIHGHESRAQEVFVIEHGVERCHHRVDRASVSKYLHLARSVESAVYLLARGSSLDHLTIPVGIFHRVTYKMVAAYLRELGTVGGVGRTLGAAFLAEERFLQVTAKMLGHSLLGILLHARVDGGVDFQAVVIYVIFRAVWLWDFFQSSHTADWSPRQWSRQ